MSYGTYNCPSDDELTAPNYRDIPHTPGLNYSCAFAGVTAAVFELPLNVKVCTLTNNTDQPQDIYASKFTGGSYARPASTSSKIIAVAAAASYPFASIDEFNRFDFLSTLAATGSVKLEPGSGPGNNLSDPDVKALTAVTP